MSVPDHITEAALEAFCRRNVEGSEAKPTGISWDEASLHWKNMIRELAVGPIHAALEAALKPRVIESAAELDALPVGSVVLDGWGTAYQKEADDDGDTYWSCFEGIIYHFKTFHGPVTLLHEGPAA